MNFSFKISIITFVMSTTAVMNIVILLKQITILEGNEVCSIILQL